MLTVTPEADAALATLLGSPEVPDGAGVRFVRGEGPDGEAAIALTLTTEPEPADEVIETTAGIELYVAADAAEALDDQELGIETSGDRVGFTLHPQNWNGGPPRV